MIRLLWGTLPALALVASADANSQVWRVTDGTSTFALDEARLASLGLTLREVEATAAPSPSARSSGRYSFRIHPSADCLLRTEDGRFAGLSDAIPHDGGFVLGLPSLSAALFDFAVEIDLSQDRPSLRVRSDASSPHVLEVINAGFLFDTESGQLTLRGGDIVISSDWAQQLGRTDLADRWIGTLEIRLQSRLVRGESIIPEPRERVPEMVLDLLLNEVYGMVSLGKIGTYPDGVLGLSFATTSCNNGEVNIPWNAPMAETHPFIGLLLLREMDGKLETIGRSWVKHAFLALANDQCDLGCVGGGGTYMAVGCSDTYSASNNGSHYYLGPRHEVNPYLAEWSCWGSFFDATPVDCIRDYHGNEPNGVNHRLEVYENDLDLPGARYYYEGVYYVADDDTLENNYGWREVTMSWNGLDWDFEDVGAPSLLAKPGPAIYAWGDAHDAERVALDDGQAVLATKVTDQGGGQWHYQYALYNQNSDRAIDAFSIAVGSANVSNVSFSDIDRDVPNDWTNTIADGIVTWETGPFGSPSTNPLMYQSVFAFGFDADVAPQASYAQLHVHKPGLGDTAHLKTQAPAIWVTSVVAGLGGATKLTLQPAQPNPFRDATNLSFSTNGRSRVRLFVADVRGRRVRTLFDRIAPAGEFLIPWDGRDQAGQRVASGIYFFRLEALGNARMTKAVLVN
jgi:hypothetical protein